MAGLEVGSAALLLQHPLIDATANTVSGGRWPPSGATARR